MRRGSLLVWRDMARLASKVGRPGRLAVFSDAAIQLCQMVKVDLSRFCSGRVLMLGSLLFEGHG